MRVYLASDHAGFELKRRLLAHLADRGYEVVDRGPETYDPDDDYPPYILRAASDVSTDEGSLGIVIGGSGNGEAIAANKVRGIRAALAWSEETARLGRQHNDANVLSLGARMVSDDDAQRFVDIFLSTPFTGEERHVRRIAMLSGFEATGAIPPA